jgi:L-ribulose-5-phosphate 3-epimerase
MTGERVLGIMQGRLVPPVEGRFQAFPRGQWAAEFAHAAAAGLGAIEWIYDAYGVGANPMETDAGIAELVEHSQAHGVAVRSVCADYFMDFPFVLATDAERAERIAQLEWLIGQAHRVGVTRIVLPFVDQSAIRDAGDREAVIETLQRALPAAQTAGIELHLETSLPPLEFAALLARIPHPLVKVNYDSGNSSSLGYPPEEEFAAYGDRVGSVHIKDRVLHGGTVPLGEGDADLDAVFAGLRQSRYGGDFILQVARGVPGDEVAWARQNRQYVESYLGLIDLGLMDLGLVDLS